MVKDACWVCIVIRDNVDIDGIREIMHEEGRYLMLDATINDKQRSLLQMCTAQILILQNYLNRWQISSNYLKNIAGDFNCSLNNRLEKDRGRQADGNTKSQIFLNGWIDEFDLLDVWSNQNLTLQHFICHKFKPYPIFTRLDFFLVSSGLYGFIHLAEIKPRYLTNHSKVPCH